MYERKYTTTLTNVWCVQNDGECNECGQRGVCDGRGHGGALDDCNRLCFREIRPRATAILRAVSRDERVRAQRPAVCYCEPRVAYIYIYNVLLRTQPFRASPRQTRDRGPHPETQLGQLLAAAGLSLFYNNIITLSIPPVTETTYLSFIRVCTCERVRYNL